MARDIKKIGTRYGNIAYTDTGEGPTALFLHGVLLNGALWDGVIDRVKDMRRCIAVDLLGHGATGAPPSDVGLSFENNADMLASFCDSIGLDAIDLVGSDSGGGIAQILAVRHPARFRSLTLTNCDVHNNWPPAAFAPARQVVASGGGAALIRRLLADRELFCQMFSIAYEHPEAISDATIVSYLGPLVATPAAIAAMERWFAASDCAQTVKLEARLQQLDIPTLVVWGTADVFFAVEWGRWLFERIRGARKLVELKGAKLLFPQERPQELAAELREHWQTASDAAHVCRVPGAAH